MDQTLAGQTIHIVQAIHIGEIIIEECAFIDECAFIEDCAHNQFKYNGIHITSIYKYDVTNNRFHTTNPALIREQIGEYAYNKLIPYLLLDLI